MSSEDWFAINCSAGLFMFSKINLSQGGVPYRFAMQCVHQASDALTCEQTLQHIMCVSPYLFDFCIFMCLPDLARNHARRHNARLAPFHVHPTGPQVCTGGPGTWGRWKSENRKKKSSGLSATSRRRLRCPSIRRHHSQVVSSGRRTWRTRRNYIYIIYIYIYIWNLNVSWSWN